MIQQKRKRSKVGLFVLCGALTVLILVMFLSFNDITEIFAEVKKANGYYILAAAGLLLLYALLSPLSLCLLARSKKTNVGFGAAYTIGMTEHFFNGITPFSTGGQPFQVYAFNKVKVKPSESTGLLLMNFILHMIVTNAFAIAALVYYDRFTATDETAMQIIAIVGFTMNFLVLLFMIALATSKRLSGLMVKMLALLGKIKFLSKWILPRVPKFQEYCDNAQAAFKSLLKKGWTTAACVLIKIVTMAIYYAITFYILRALNVPVGYEQMFYVMCGSSFAITMVVFLPTPGSSGGIEFAFKNIFASIAGVSGTVAYGGMLIWRLLTYYLLMLFSVLFYVGFEIYVSKIWRPKHAHLFETQDGGQGEAQEGQADAVVTADGGVGQSTGTEDSDAARDGATAEENSGEGTT